MSWNRGSRNRDTGSRSTALKFNLVDPELTALGALARGKLHFDALCSTTLIICNSSTRSSTRLCLLASRSISHTIVKLNICVLVDGNIKLSDREGLVTTNFIAEFTIAQIGFNAFALYLVSIKLTKAKTW